jgi:antitoxin component YwqK of YwqJK toxin-antitoxin module
MRLLTILCLVLLVSCSQEVPIETPTEVTPQPLEVVTGLFLVRDGITYHQDTNEPVTGIVETYDDDGQLVKRETFKDGESTGIYEEFEYFRNGQLAKRANYRDGKDHGLYEAFYKNGQLWIRANSIDGELADQLAEQFHENGQLRLRGNLKNQGQDGLWEEFDEDGNLISTEMWKDGELVEENDNP